MKLRHVLLITSLFTSAACASAPTSQTAADVNAGEVYRAARASAVAEMSRNFEQVQFLRDSAQITPESRAALAANADIMRQFGELELVIEGHCDSSGSTEYNMALGQRRADSIRKYLVTTGVEGARLSTISYGEEVPSAFGDDVESFQINRRAEFVTTGDGVRGHVFAIR